MAVCNSGGLLLVTTPEGTVKIVKNVVVPSQSVISGKNTLTSLLTSSNKIAGRRILMTKGPDGTTRVVTGAPGTNVVPKTVQNPQQQSLIKMQTTSGQQLQAVQQIIQQPAQQQQVQGMFLSVVYLDIKLNIVFLTRGY